MLNINIIVNLVYFCLPKYFKVVFINVTSITFVIPINKLKLNCVHNNVHNLQPTVDS